MNLSLRVRRPAEPEQHAAPAVDRGWTTVRGQAATARAATTGLWVLLLGGAGCGVAALIRPAPSPVAVAAPASAAAAPVDPGAAGFAQLFLVAYLDAGQEDEAAATAYFPRMPALTNHAHTRRATLTAVVGERTAGTGYTAVTLAAFEQTTATAGGTWSDAGWHYFTVAVRGAAGAYTAAALPAEVAAPALLAGAAPAYGVAAPPTPGSPLSDAVAHFLTAYLAGNGELARYTTPSAHLSPVAPPAYPSVNLTSLAVADNPNLASAPAAPADGTVVHLLAGADGIDAAGSAHPLNYALTLTVRAGYWTVTSLDPAPALVGVPAPAPAPPPSTPAAPPSPAAAPTGPASPSASAN